MAGSLTGGNLRRTADRNLIEQQLVRACRSLFLVGADENELRMIPLARFGAYEVRLVGLSGDVATCWVELYAHDTATSLDSFRFAEPDGAVDEADALIAQARDLDQLSQKR